MFTVVVTVPFLGVAQGVIVCVSPTSGSVIGIQTVLEAESSGIVNGGTTTTGGSGTGETVIGIVTFTHNPAASQTVIHTESLPA